MTKPDSPAHPFEDLNCRGEKSFTALCSWIQAHPYRSVGGCLQCSWTHQSADNTSKTIVHNTCSVYTLPWRLDADNRHLMSTNQQLFLLEPEFLRSPEPLLETSPFSLSVSPPPSARCTCAAAAAARASDGGSESPETFLSVGPTADGLDLARSAQLDIQQPHA